MVDIAAKQRHVLLLKKVRNNQPLTASEMRELKTYEMATKKKTAVRKKAATKGAGADARAVFLEQLAELAGAPGVSAPQAAERLGMTAAAFEKLLAKDTAAGAVWRNAKTDALVRAGKILWKLADDGNTAAARQILENLRETVGGGLAATAMTVRAAAELVGEKTARLDYWYRKHGMPKNVDGTIDLRAFLAWWQRYLVGQHTFDPHRVKLVELEPFLGVARQTINEWLKDGLPRNADKTFGLPAVFAWRIKQLGLRPAERPTQVNELAMTKAEKLRLELDVARGKLVARGKVEMGLAARAAVIVAVLDRMAAELPTLLAHLTAENIKPELDKFFDTLRTAAATVPEDIAQVIAPGRRKKLERALAELVGD